MKCRWARLLSVFIASQLLLGGCVGHGVGKLPLEVHGWASLSQDDAPKVDSSLKDRFEAFWAHYYGKEFETCYEFESSEFKSRFSREFYVGYYSNAWTVLGMSVQRAQALSDGQVVFDVKLTQKSKEKGEVRINYFRDYWEKEGEIWMRRLDDPMLRNFKP